MICNDCPRKCNVNLNNAVGFCSKQQNTIRVAKVMRHFWEEPTIVGKNGSGAVFFSHCNLKCKFCQNHQISFDGQGRDFSIKEFANLLKRIDATKVENINLVTPTHYTSQILQAFNIYKPQKTIVWNTSGYEHNLERLKGIVDVFLFDVKYYDNNLALHCSKAGNYFEICLKALKQAREIVGPDVIENSVMKRGIIVRHLILPNHTEDSIKIFENIKKEIGTDVCISLMSQYVPMHLAKQDESLNRPISKLEYKKVFNSIIKMGFKNGFWQEFSSATKEYTPNFSQDKFFEL